MQPLLLILVSAEADGPALLPVAGRPLVALQLRRAAAAGLDEAMVVAERYPPALAAAIDRLRDDGLVIHVAADAADAAQQVPAGRPLVLVSGAVLPTVAALEAVAALPAAALMTLEDGPGLDDWERIDAATRWAGLARLDGQVLRATAEMLGDWDLELTLVRRLAARAGRMPAPPDMVVRVADADGAAMAAGTLAARPHRLVRPLLERTLATRVESRHLRNAALVLAAGGAGSAAILPPLSLALLAAAGPLDRLGRLVAEARLDRPAHEVRRRRIRLSCMAAALIAYGARLSAVPGWEPALMALVTLAFLVAGAGAERLSGLVPERLSPRPEAMLWAAALPILPGFGPWALGGLMLWAAGGFFRLQWRALRNASAQ